MLFIYKYRFVDEQSVSFMDFILSFKSTPFIAIQLMYFFFASPYEYLIAYLKINFYILEIRDELLIRYKSNYFIERLFEM